MFANVELEDELHNNKKSCMRTLLCDCDARRQKNTTKLHRNRHVFFSHSM